MAEAGKKRSADVNNDAVDVDSDSDADNDADCESATPRKKVKLKNTNVHQEFERITSKLKGGKEEIKSYCKHCNTSYVGKNPTTLWKHLKSKHPKIYEQVQEKDNNQRLEILEEKVEVKSSSNLKTAGEAIFGERGRQNKIDKYISVRSKSLPPRPKEKEQESDKKLALWIGGSTLPISIVEDPNFEMYLQSYDPQARTPSRRKLRKLVNNMSDEVRGRMKNAMGKARR